VLTHQFKQLLNGFQTIKIGMVESKLKEQTTNILAKEKSDIKTAKK